MFSSLNELIPTSAGMKGPEQRDAAYGRVFALICLVRCGRLLGKGGDVALLGEIVQELVSNAGKKVYLKGICVETILLVMESVAPEVAQRIVPRLRPLLAVQPTTADALALALACQTKQQLNLVATDAALADVAWCGSREDMYSAKHLPTLVAVLSQTADQLPYMHATWRYVLAEWSSRTPAQLQSVWSTVVDEGGCWNCENSIGFLFVDVRVCVFLCVQY